MAIDVNINNQNKHWLLEIIGKCKTAIMVFLKGILKCACWIGRLLKKIWKYILGVVLIGALIIGGIAAYDYYIYTYIPQKKLDAAIEEIKVGINSSNDSIKAEYALYVLDKEHEWNFEDVEDSDIYSRLSAYHKSSFKLIESKAYAGEARWQYHLGQLYAGEVRWQYWFGKNIKYEDKRFSFAQLDKTKAAYWWNEAALQNYTPAYNNLGMAYKGGEGVQVDLRKAVYYLKLGAEAGDDLAQKNYGDLFLEGVSIQVGCHKEERVTCNYIRDRVRTYWDNKREQTMYVYLEEVPDFEFLVPKDIEQAKYWWKKAAAQGNEVAKDRLQKIYE